MSAGMDVGRPHADRSAVEPAYLLNGDIGYNGGGTSTSGDPSAMMANYENVFGPAAREIKWDAQRHKRHQRWHLPDALKGSNTFLTDRIDGLITDATSSPFTKNILPYLYMENPDQKIKWNVYSFDEGMASRVPYESAARVLPQSKRSFAGYAVRHGLAIAMEHNFMMSPQGMENFRRQLMQLVGSIQLTNDLDVHMALLYAPSYQKHMDEKYWDGSKTLTQMCRMYVDLFGFVQKNENALDYLIEDAKNHLTQWGSKPPTFMLTNGALTRQLTMTPERTNYITAGPDGKRKLAAGPDLPSYRGLSIINTRQFSLESGTAPRDMLRRRVRVSEHYRIPWELNNLRKRYEFYDQSRDSMFYLSWLDLFKAGLPPTTGDAQTIFSTGDGRDGYMNLLILLGVFTLSEGLNVVPAPDPVEIVCKVPAPQGFEYKIFKHQFEGTNDDKAMSIAKLMYGENGNTQFSAWLRGKCGTEASTEIEFVCLASDLFILRPNIEHYMLGVIMGRGGGPEELGATFWGQTELSCYDDSQHGLWGMSYKYHERAIVINERNLIRVFDVCFDGYCGGNDANIMTWTSDDCERFRNSTQNLSTAYTGPSMVVMVLPQYKNVYAGFPNPLVWHPFVPDPSRLKTQPDRGGTPRTITQHCPFAPTGQATPTLMQKIYGLYYKALGLNLWAQMNTPLDPGHLAYSNETDPYIFSFHGHMTTILDGHREEVQGSGHLGPNFVGVASVREGRGLMPRGKPMLAHLV